MRTYPTFGRATIRLVIALMTEHGWVPRSVNGRTTFLSGFRLWQLRKCACGLIGSLRRWYEAVVALLLSLGYNRCEVNQGLFFRFVCNHFLFVIATHVKDVLCGGQANEGQRFVTALRKSFAVGPTRSSVKVGTPTFTELRVVTDADPSSGSLTIKVDQDHNLSTIDAVLILEARISNNAAAVSWAALTKYRWLVGAFSLDSWQTQPYLACASSLLARRSHEVVVKDLMN